MYPKAVLTFPMPGSADRERLLRSVVDVYTDPVGDTGRVGRGATPEEIATDGPASALGAEDEALLAAVRTALSEIVVAVSGGSAAPQGATAAALKGAELTLRMELAAGVRDGLPRLLPGFAYMVTLPALGEPRAARLARRVRELGECHGGDAGEDE